MTVRLKSAIAGLALMTLAAGGPATLPPVPPLPSSGFPAIARSATFARELIDRVPAARLESMFGEDPALIPPVLRTLGSALLTTDAKLRASVESYLVALAREHAARVAPHFSDSDLRVLVSLQLVDPVRFREEPAFRARVTPLLPRMLDPAMPLAMRARCLEELNAAIGIDFDTAEKIAVAWKVVRRSSAFRKTAYAAKTLRMPDDTTGPITASVFSLRSGLFSPDEARAFLSAVRTASPKRHLVVLGDAPIEEATRDLGVDFVDARGREYSPWPRDPFIVARSTDGVVFVNRPNLQPEREEDANMVRALIQSLPDDGAWGKARWTVAPVPFHNGHVLLTPSAAWISIHTVEIRALELLRLARVPVEWFDKPEGIERYLTAVRAAAADLEGIYGRPVRFVHPLQAKPALMTRLGGGAGFDLDSLMMILPGAKPQALVGDLGLGARVARSADWTAARGTYRMRASGADDIADAQSSARNAALQSFLDTVAAHLAAKGMTVRRLPLIHVPQQAFEEAPKDVLLTWTNVVLDEGKRAEGFASLLAEGDAVANQTFSDAGWRLVLFPPLGRSVTLNGGYRCASNHLR